MGCGASHNAPSTPREKYAHPSYADGYEDATTASQGQRPNKDETIPQSSPKSASRKSDAGESSTNSSKQFSSSGGPAGEGSSSLTTIVMTLPECAYCPMCIQRAKMLPADQVAQLRASDRWWCNGEGVDGANVDAGALVEAVRFVVASNPNSIAGQLTSEQSRVMNKLLENHSDTCYSGARDGRSVGAESSLTAFERGMSARSDTGSMSFSSMRASASNLQPAAKIECDSPCRRLSATVGPNQRGAPPDLDPIPPALPAARGYNHIDRFDMSLVSCSSFGDAANLTTTTPRGGSAALFNSAAGKPAGGDTAVLDAGPGELQSPSNGGRNQQQGSGGAVCVPPLAFGFVNASSNNRFSPRTSPRLSPRINVPPQRQQQHQQAITPRGSTMASHVSEGSSSTIGGEDRSSSSDGGSSRTSVSTGGVGDPLRTLAIGLGYQQRVVDKNVIWVSPTDAANRSGCFSTKDGAGQPDMPMRSPRYDVQAYDEKLPIEEQVARLRPRHDSVGHVSAEQTGLSSVLRRKLRERDAIKRVESEGPGAMDRDVQRHVELCREDLAQPAPPGDKYPGNGKRMLRRRVWKWMNKQPHHAPCVGCELEHRRCYQILVHDGSMLTDYERVRRLLERANSQSALEQRPPRDGEQIELQQQLEQVATALMAIVAPLSLCAACSCAFSRHLHTCN